MRCFLGFGSNDHREENLSTGLSELAKHIEIVAVSPIYESDALGFDGAPFLNFCVEVALDRDITNLKSLLKSIENKCGRDRSAPKYSARTLDIDILWIANLFGCYDGVELPRDEVFRNSFVLKPLVDIAPELTHPSEGRLIDLWSNYDVRSMPVTQVDSGFLKRRAQ